MVRRSPRLLDEQTTTNRAGGGVLANCSSSRDRLRLRATGDYGKSKLTAATIRPMIPLDIVLGGIFMAVYKAKAIIPHIKLSPENALKGQRRARQKTAKAAEAAFEHETRRWKTPVTFFTVDDGEIATIGTNSDIFLFNDQPTKRHQIRARRRRRLAFYSQRYRRMAFPIEVTHPGTKGKYITKRLALKMSGEYYKNMRDEMEKLAG